MCYFCLIVCVVISGAYFLFIIYTIAGWYKTRKHLYLKDTSSSNSNTDVASLFVSVIISARNEEHNIPSLIAGLRAQDYPSKLLELIIVDDCSTDNTLALLQNYESAIPQLKVLSCSKFNINGKKAALQLAASKAQGSALLFTDADCIHPPSWVREMANTMKQTKAAMLLGPVVLLQEKGLLSLYQQAEIAALQAVTAGFSGWNTPVMCNAANLMIERNSYIQDLKIQIPSGDDIFLLHAVKREQKGRIIYHTNQHAMVTTCPERNIKNFFGQRLRWASKSVMYNDWLTIALAILVALANIGLTLMFVLAIALPTIMFVQFLTVLAFKCFSDMFLLGTVSSFFRLPARIFIFFPLFVMFTSLYYTIVALKTIFAPKFIWKGRRSL